MSASTTFTTSKILNISTKLMIQVNINNTNIIIQVLATDSRAYFLVLYSDFAGIISQFLCVTDVLLFYYVSFRFYDYLLDLNGVE